MYQISIVSSSVRIDRKSHHVALYLKSFLEKNQLAQVEILDLLAFNFPIFDERLSKQKNPSEDVLIFQKKIIAVDGIIIVTPEYNGSIPASLKNVIDLLYDEWHRKPVAFSTVSSGNFAGNQALTHLQFIFWKVRAWTFTGNFPVANVQDKFNHLGVPTNIAETDALAQKFVDEFYNCIESSQK